MQSQRILHIANDFTGSTVYKELGAGLDILGVEQIFYTAFRDKRKCESNSIDFKLNKSKIIYSPILNSHIDRLIYPIKIIKIIKDIESKVDFSQIKLIHAHTWYSDGGVAYFLSKKYEIPYIITVRNTDLNIFNEKLIYLRGFGKLFLLNAKKIIAISDIYKSKILNLKNIKPYEKVIANNIITIPNGVNNYWLNEMISFKKNNLKKEKFNILYIGKFNKNKNIYELIKSIDILVEKYDVTLHIVGGGGDYDSNVMGLINKNKNLIFYGQISDKNQLRSIFEKCDIFAMPSKYETFGLVYIEAMLQGLPILYTKGEGIDGFYNNIGEKISNHSPDDIAEALSKMILNFTSYNIPLLELKKNHDWMEISKKMKSIYDID